MRVPRIFVPLELGVAKEVVIPKQGSQHLREVLRLKKGARITLFNGNGAEYTAEIRDLNRSKVVATTLSKEVRETESPLKITLAQVVSKPSDFEYCLQKGTELGVSAFIPLHSKRSVTRDLQALKAKHDRWNSIIYGACEQCGRNSIPTLATATEITGWLQGIAQSSSSSSSSQGEVRTLNLMLDPRGSKGIHDLANNSGPRVQSVNLITGPEGGFDEAEVAFARASGFQTLKLGPRVLRATTAPVTAITVAQLMWGDLSCSSTSSS